MTNAETANDMIQPKQKILRLILGDQLNIEHSWFKTVDASITYVLMEVKSETDYVKHHIQKVIGFFAAMRNFSSQLQEQHHDVIYIKINDPSNLQRFDKNCLDLIEHHNFTKFEYQLPDEYRVDQHLKSFAEQLEIPAVVYDTEHFYCSRNELGEVFKEGKSLVMESFYRYMRKKHGVLVDKEDKPLNGKWNFDQDNRKKLPGNHKPVAPFLFSNQLAEIEKEIHIAKIQTIGSTDSANFIWPINRAQSLQLLDFFIQHCLPLFGTYQDAMAQDEWSVYHSRLSFSLNIKLLSPKEVVEKAIHAYFNNTNTIEFHQLEGFIRQIIGWREYMRGIYWLKMPEFGQLNFFNHKAHLPQWFWTGNTKMNCLKNTIHQSLEFAYAHHIQRLMITGNFLLLAGIDPDEVDVWYLGIYIDALEWVEITNTRGMSQYADGGIVGTKPYVSSAAYINKMSNYCSGCHYDYKQKTGPNACPFNSLYWDFYNRHEQKLSKNPRIGMSYVTWKKMNPEAKSAILQQAAYFLQNINQL